MAEQANLIKKTINMAKAVKKKEAYGKSITRCNG
jgi:hypothetical protein